MQVFGDGSACEAVVRECAVDNVVSRDRKGQKVGFYGIGHVQPGVLEDSTQVNLVSTRWTSPQTD